ncbi:MAG: mannitol dehydrogenase [Defluviitaleaceae bacterium]|nr:mannitol dehydrogenase [Defluviitaleaceae bacterium]
MGLFVQYGAGNIGRGFIGALFARSGYEVVFIDVDPVVVSALNERRQYILETVSNEGAVRETVSGVSAVDGKNAESAADIISKADCMATAVGVNILPRIAPVIANGLKKRWAATNTDPLNIIICENLIEAGKLLRGLIEEHLSEDERKLFGKTVGLVEASIGRMVPAMTAEEKNRDPLFVRAEDYHSLPVDAEAVKGSLPKADGLHPVAPFEFYMRRKLFLHNMSHALTAYAGFINGYEYIWQAVSDPNVKLLAERAMIEASLALHAEYGIGMDSLLQAAADMLIRYHNRALGDTISRVGADTFRKLSPNDRLAGAARLCFNHGIEPVYICAGITAALVFENEDSGTKKINEQKKDRGILDILRGHCMFDEGSAAEKYVTRYTDALCKNANASALLAEAESIVNEVNREKRIV